MRATPRKSKVSFASIMSGTTLRLGKPILFAVAAVACLFLMAVDAAPTEECDKSQCKGPIRYYEDLKCKPVYENPGDCCALRYDCSHLFVASKSADKCLINGHEYAVGEHLKDEDRPSPCDIGCLCSPGYNGKPRFMCAAVDCFNIMHVKPGCYFKHAPDSCCGGEEVCTKEGEEVKVKCEVEGQTYFEGQYFYPSGDAQLSCRCMEGYKGENVEPFCKPSLCGTELRHGNDVRENCVPVFYSSQSPRTSCSVSYRCQNNKDAVVPKEGEKAPEAKAVSDDMKCKFGNMTLNIGDELNQATDYSSVCVKCVCEVPPAPTCQRLPDEACDVTNHPPFDQPSI